MHQNEMNGNREVTDNGQGGDASGAKSRMLSSGILTSVLSRGAAALVPILSVPLMLEALGVSAFGAWSAAIALTAVVAFADLGLGVGLMTRLSAARAHEDRQQSLVYVSTAYSVLAGVSALLVCVVLWTSTVVDVGLIVGADAGDVLARQATLIVMVAYILNIPASLIVRIQYACGEMGRSNIWQALISFASLLVLVLMAQTDAPAVFFICVVAFVPILGNVLNGVVFFTVGTGRSFRPSLMFANLHVTKTLLNLGLRFLTISTLMGVALGADAWIVAQTNSPEAAANYAIPARVFGLLGVLVSVLTIPMWPVAVRAFETGDAPWLRRTTRRMIRISVASVSLAAVVGVLAGPAAITLWLGGKVLPSTLLLVGFGLMAIAQAAMAPIFMVQNAAEVLKFQLVAYGVLTVLFPVKWWVSQTFGYELLPLVSFLGLCGIVLPLAFVGYRASIRTLDQRS